jgi:hypothetical protein
MRSLNGHHHHQHQHGAPGDSPVLDIGGEVGALIVYLARQTATGELHACPTSDPVAPAALVDTNSASCAQAFESESASIHTGVHPREIDGTTTWVALFPEVTEGAYHLLDDDGAPMARVAVTGGHVQELDLRLQVPRIGHVC